MSGLDFDLTVSLSLLLSVITIVFAWFRTRRKDQDEQFRAVDERLTAGSRRMNAYDLRIQSLEQTIENLPGKDHLHRLEVALANIGGDMKSMSTAMGAMAESQRRTEKIVGAHEAHLRESN